MHTYAAPEIADGVFHVGCRDWKRRVFDALAITPLGTTYNSYIVKGAEKTALIDTNHKGFEHEFSGKIAFEKNPRVLNRLRIGRCGQSCVFKGGSGIGRSERGAI